MLTNILVIGDVMKMIQNNEKNIVYFYITNDERESEKYIETINSFKNKGYFVITYVSGNEDIKDGLTNFLNTYNN